MILDSRIKAASMNGSFIENRFIHSYFYISALSGKDTEGHTILIIRSIA
jgi:hypothetical protein